MAVVTGVGLPAVFGGGVPEPDVLADVVGGQGHFAALKRPGSSGGWVLPVAVRLGVVVTVVVCFVLEGWDVADRAVQSVIDEVTG